MEKMAYRQPSGYSFGVLSAYKVTAVKNAPGTQVLFKTTQYVITGPHREKKKSLLQIRMFLKAKLQKLEEMYLL